MGEDGIAGHCAEINRCNQRGGRMLSAVDLVEAGTMTPDLGAYALAAIQGGASFMVGALPGGAGKTTVMGALLNFTPRDVVLAPAADGASVEHGFGIRDRHFCFICHEIGAGPYYAYLWGQELRRYFDLPLAGHMLATNLHADTREQAEHQVCAENGVESRAFRRMNLIFFLRLRRNAGKVSREIVEAWESDGKEPHRRVFVRGQDENPAALSRIVTVAQVEPARRRIAELLASGKRRIEEVRAMILRRQPPA